MLILTEKDLKECVFIGEEELKEIENAFSSLAQDEVVMPPVQRLDVTGKQRRDRCQIGLYQRV